MARRRTRRASSKAALTEYKKARAALLRRISRAKKAGYDVSSFKVPGIPKYIREGSARRLRVLGKKFGRAKKSGQIKLIDLPTYENKLVDVVDTLIRNAQTWVDEPLSRQMLIRHRGDLSREQFELHGLNYDEYMRKVANANIKRSYPSLVTRLEIYIIDSKGGWDGDLTELVDIFLTMTTTKDFVDLTEEERKDIYSYAENFSKYSTLFDGDDLEMLFN